MGIHDFIAHYQILSVLESLWLSIILWPIPEGLDGGLLTSD